MTTPPRVTATDAAAAIERITRRHRGTDNPGQHQLTDDPRDVLAYLRKCGTRRLLGDDASHDLEDALTLRLFLWWEAETTELWIFDAVEALRFPRRRLRHLLGITSNVGWLNRHTRKRKLLRPDRDVGPPSGGTATPSSTTGDAALREYLGLLYAQLDKLPDDVAEEVHAIHRDAAGAGTLPAAARSALALIVRELLGSGVDPAPAGTRLAARHLGIRAASRVD